MPFVESLRNSGEMINNATQYGMQQSKFRVLSTQAKVSFTGSNFYNQGSACTARLAYNLDGNYPATAPSSLTNDAYFQQYADRLPQQPPDSFASIGALAGARTFPVTQSVHMINSPLQFDYQEMKDAWVPYYSTSVATTQKDVVFGGMMNVHLSTGPDVFATAGSDGIYGIGYGPITFYAATGLAASPNVIVTGN